ncbi:Golgi phospho protein 3 [Stereum hirsutum FP-91666 SS1]|uniref:Golgi phospho protein 3 n=1 Tax=Stereum hirsutum (strain FP-91666) TaxID=721885 RepID=UPI00044496FE|nr:Golgi phospho protein 3 [Stereum hirsutum FP-91666 SS1]EIM81868.1 Golgi phospho protein 3 [Stereum hirsutum FP-91666 SS1]
MSTSTGLSRRRVNPSSGDNSTESFTNGHTSSGSNGTAAAASSASPVGVHAGSAFAGGSKIAYDPRDLERDDEELRTGGKMPKLTIMEEVLLLGLKDRQGYLSFWNDNISYALRGCILIELSLRRRIAMYKDPNRRRLPLSERLVQVIDDRQTGETLLDEALKMMKAQEAVERMSVNSWIDLLSGETWNVLKIGYQLKQVRERLAKGLVDKGVLRTEKRNFLLFDMATHPVADVRTKDALVTRVVSLLTATTSTVPATALDRDEQVQMRTMRSVCLVCAAYAASVLDNAFGRLGYEEREAAFARCDDILAEFAVWPFGATGSGSGSGSAPGPGGVVGAGAVPGATPRRRAENGSRIGMGGVGNGREAVLGLMQEVRKEMSGGDEDLGGELVAAVLEVLSKLDSLL